MPCRCDGEPMSRAPGQPKEDAASARRLLQRLTDQGHTLRRVEGCYRLMRQSTQQAARVPESLISLCMRRDWLKRERAGPGSVRRRPGVAPSRWRERRSVPAPASDQGDRPSGCRGRSPPRDGERDGEPISAGFESRKDRNGRPLIADAQYAAGERLRADYWFAELGQRVTSNWSAPAPADRSRRAAPSRCRFLAR